MNFIRNIWLQNQILQQYCKTLNICHLEQILIIIRFTNNDIQYIFISSRKSQLNYTVYFGGFIEVYKNNLNNIFQNIIHITHNQMEGRYYFHTNRGVSYQSSLQNNEHLETQYSTQVAESQRSLAQGMVSHHTREIKKKITSLDQIVFCDDVPHEKLISNVKQLFLITYFMEGEVHIYGNTKLQLQEFISNLYVKDITKILDFQKSRQNGHFTNEIALQTEISMKKQIQQLSEDRNKIQELSNNYQKQITDYYDQIFKKRHKKWMQLEKYIKRILRLPQNGSRDLFFYHLQQHGDTWEQFSAYQMFYFMMINLRKTLLNVRQKQNTICQRIIQFLLEVKAKKKPQLSNLDNQPIRHQFVQISRREPRRILQRHRQTGIQIQTQTDTILTKIQTREASGYEQRDMILRKRQVGKISRFGKKEISQGQRQTRVSKYTQTISLQRQVSQKSADNYKNKSQKKFMCRNDRGNKPKLQQNMMEKSTQKLNQKSKSKSRQKNNDLISQILKKKTRADVRQVLRSNIRRTFTQMQEQIILDIRKGERRIFK